MTDFTASTLSNYLIGLGVNAADPMLTDAMNALPATGTFNVSLDDPTDTGARVYVDNSSSNETIDTSAAGLSHLHQVWLLQGTTLTLTGPNNVFVADTAGSSTVIDNGTGNDVIDLAAFSGGGVTAIGGAGHDTIVSYAAGNTLIGGTGEHQLLVDEGSGGSTLQLSASYQTAMDSAGTSGDSLNDAAGFSHQHLILNGSNDTARVQGDGTFLDLVGSNNTAVILGNGGTITSEGINNFVNIKAGTGGQHIVDTGGGLMVQDSMMANLDLSGVASNMATLNMNNALFTAANITSEKALLTGGEAITFNDGVGDIATLRLTNVILNLNDGSTLTIDGASPHWATADAAHAINIVGTATTHLDHALHIA